MNDIFIQNQMSITHNTSSRIWFKWKVLCIDVNGENEKRETMCEQV